jgi:hypothetical protein
MTRPAFKPMKPRPPGTVKGCVADLYAQVGGVERVMVRLGTGQAATYAYADPTREDEISFARVAALTSREATAAVEFLASLAGGAFVPMPKTNSEVGQLTADAVRQSGESAAQLVQALLDGKLSPDEARAALPDLTEAVQAYAQLLSTVAAIARGEEGR